MTATDPRAVMPQSDYIWVFKASSINWFVETMFEPFEVVEIATVNVLKSSAFDPELSERFLWVLSACQVFSAEPDRIPVFKP
jgi:hypothetical protein